MSFVVCVYVCIPGYIVIYRFSFFLNKNIYRGFIEGPKRTSASSSICMYVYMYVCSVLACVLHRHIDIYIIERSRQRLSVNVDGALPSVGSVVPWDMTHAITGRRGTLYQLLAIATTRGGPRCEIQRVPPHTHTAPNNINRQIESP